MNTIEHPLPSWSPPSGYQPVESKVDGITVFAPGKIEQPTETPTTYCCPNCGANTRYNVSAGGVACEYCGYAIAAQAEQVGTHAEEHEFTLETLAVARHGWAEDARNIHCEACGAELIVEKAALTTTCPFCGSNRVNARGVPIDLLRPQSLIPFKMTLDVIRQKAKEWLGKGWFHPAELSSVAGIDRFTGIYLPFWTFDAAIDSHWKAQVGYERQERYYDHGDKTWKSRTVIDWRWEDGNVSIVVDDLLLSGTTRLSRRILERLYPYDLSALVEYQPDFLAGWQAQTFDLPLNDAWEDAKEQMREQAKDACHADIPTSHVRSFSMSADFRNEVWRYVLLPVYLASYRIGDKVYQVMVNGQNGVLAGQKPVAWWKVWLAIAALVGPGAVLGLISLPLLVAGGIGLVPLVIGGVMMVVGAVFSVIIYKQAVESEAS